MIYFLFNLKINNSLHKQDFKLIEKCILLKITLFLIKMITVLKIQLLIKTLFLALSQPYLMKPNFFPNNKA
jgi:hypothetical protein